MQEPVLRLVDFSHSALCDKANDDESVVKNLPGYKPSPRCPRSIHRRLCVRGPFSHGLIEEIQWRMFKEAAHFLLFGQPLLNQASQLGIVGTHLIEHTDALGRLERLNRQKHLLSEFFSSSHGRPFAKAVELGRPVPKLRLAR